MKLREEWLPWAFVALSFVLSAAFYFQLPDVMVTHWDAQGMPNGWMGKNMATLFMPVLGALLVGLFYLIPKIDPLGANIAKFKDVYWGFVSFMALFMAYIHGVSLALNAGYGFNITYAIIPALAVLFYYVGYMMERVQPTWFIGIRTPWTMSSEGVWKKTHALGAKLFKAFAVVVMLTLFTMNYSFYIVIAGALACGIVPVVYSYLEFQKEKTHVKPTAMKPAAKKKGKR
ncbi:MAG: SdpI family protein [Candidatus Micrarchaeota archaeon]